MLPLVRTTRNTPNAVDFRLGEPVSPEPLRGIQALVHCAYDFALLRRDDIARVNVNGSKKLFSAAREAGIPKVVCVSSISAFEGCRSIYGKAKMEIEDYARAQGAFVIRPGLIFGDPPGGMFGRLVAQVARSSIVPLIGNGSQVQFLVHQNDVAALIAGCCTGAIATVGVPITVAHPRPWPMRELLAELGRRLNRTPVLIPTPPRLIWWGLKLTEALGLRLAFRSDSVVSLLNQDSAPDFTVLERLGVVCRPFA